MPGKRTETLKVNFGPQHPSTHGVLYIKAELDGEMVKEAKPQLGYLHRAIEKLAENRQYHQSIPGMDRCDYISPYFNELAYMMSVEKLADIKVPERAQYLRVILCELNRITSHQIAVGSFFNDVGAFYTPFLYHMADREKLLDLWEEISGSRMLPNFLRFGGLREDAPEGWLGRVVEFCDFLETRLVELQAIQESEIFEYRTRGVAAITAEEAINIGVTGPILRATGFNRDIRRDIPYLVYDKLDFNVITAKTGDLRACYEVRIGEMYESCKIIKQAVKDIPEGPVRTKVPSPFTPPKGDAFVPIESAKGEMGAYVVSDGTDKPYRMKLRAPSFANLRALEEMARDWKIADLIVILGNIDIVLGDVDR